MTNPTNENDLKKKWKPIIENVDLAPAIKDEARKLVTTQLLENTERECRAQRLNESGNMTTGVDFVDPILINLVRRTAPNNMAFDTVGVQAMDRPTGLIFALRALRGPMPLGPHGRPGDARSTHITGSPLDSNNETEAQAWGAAGIAPNEALKNESDTTFSGAGTQTSNATAPDYNAYSVGTAMSTSVGETLGRGETGDGSFNEMSFTIEKTAVESQVRKLKASYTFELAQDLKAVHGLDAEKLLADILSTEITAETNREIINRLRKIAKVGAAEVEYSNGSVVLDSNNAPVTSLAGSFDVNVNSDGRWQGEKYKSLLMKISKEANAIAKDTRRGRGNFIICSSDVAAALDLSGKLTISPELVSNLPADDTGNTFAGMLSGRIKVYIDPYVGYDEIIVGYKGATQLDAGMFYCPYVPLQMYKALSHLDFQPSMAFSTRYGIVANPFTTLNRNGNSYYRKFKVSGI